MNDQRFEDYLIERANVVDNALFDALGALATKPIEWDMSMIGDLADQAEAILKDHGIEFCHPYCVIDGNSEVPCYLASDCKNAMCPFGRKETTGRAFSGVQQNDGSKDA